VTEHRVISNRHTGEPERWCCNRCYTYSPVVLPFTPIEPPYGGAQILAALKTLAIYAPVLLKVDEDLLYRVTWKFFNAGWCVRDILRAIDYRPDDSPHETAAINMRDPGELIAGRIQTRLREWTWRHRFDDEGGVMPGPYTAMRKAMRVRADEQKVRAFLRGVEWSEQERLAQEARERGAPASVRQQVAIACELAKIARREGDRREAAALADLVARARDDSGKAAVDELAFSRIEG
jgi:hypothetical protein